MLIIRKFKYIVAILLYIVSISCSAKNDVIRELNAGKAVVLIINAKVDNKSEQYADWAHYLNQFSSNVGTDYVFHKLSIDKLNKLIVNADQYSKNYSIIFMKEGKPSFFYNGAIVEPQVYKFIQLTYLGKEIKPKYLKQFSPKQVNVEFKVK